MASEKVADREGFEPPVQLPVRRISSAVLSTTQPPVRRGHPLLTKCAKRKIVTLGNPCAVRPFSGISLAIPLAPCPAPPVNAVAEPLGPRPNSLPGDSVT